MASTTSNIAETANATAPPTYVTSREVKRWAAQAQAAKATPTQQASTLRPSHHPTPGSPALPPVPSIKKGKSPTTGPSTGTPAPTPVARLPHPVAPFGLFKYERGAQHWL